MMPISGAVGPFRSCSSGCMTLRASDSLLRQTASGSSSPEMSIEGILAADQLRDYLYAQMRGAKGIRQPQPAAEQPSLGSVEPPDAGDEALALLREIRDLLRQRTPEGRAEP